MPEYTQANSVFRVHTPLGEGVLLLRRIRGTEGISELFDFELDVLADNRTDVAFDAVAAGDKLPELLRQANDGRLADVVVLCTGAESAIAQGLSCLANGSTFIVFAVPAPGSDYPMPLNDLWRREVTVRTSYGAAPADLATARPEDAVRATTPCFTASMRCRGRLSWPCTNRECLLPRWTPRN